MAFKLDFTPSKYQQEIFDFVVHGVGNAVIRATAGSGKTKTIVTAMKLVPKKNKCLFIAYNKSIVNELSKRVEGYSNCTVNTLHGLGLKMLGKNYPDTKFNVDEYKYKTYLKNNIDVLSTIDFESNTLTTKIINQYIDSITELINFSRYNLATSSKEVAEIASKYDIPYMYDECDVVMKCLEWGKNNLDTIDYTDMIWLPYELQLNPKGLQYDWIFGDEVQDFSKAYVDLMLRCFKRGTRFIVAGDSSQCINQFSGSSGDAFSYMCNYPNTRIFTLPISYRCDKAIVKVAQESVSEIQYRDDAGDGEVFTDCSVSEINDGDMVLCRSRSPLIKLYNKLLKEGKNCYIKGHDIGRNLIDLVKSFDIKELNENLLSDGLFIRMYERLLINRNNLVEKHGLDVADASLSSSIMSLYDSINTLQTLSAECKDKNELIEKIDSIFKEESDGICLSTIHKSKGLESDNVFILCRSTMPPKRIKKDWEREQENNLIFVAVTRAKHKLGYINEKEVPPSGNLLDPDLILKDIAYAEKRVMSVLGKDYTVNSNNPIMANFRLKVATVIKDFHENDNKVIINNSNAPSEQFVNDLEIDDPELMEFLAS